MTGNTLEAQLLDALRKGFSNSWVANAGITNDIEALRAICLEHADWWNNVAWPLIEKAEKRLNAPEPRP